MGKEEKQLLREIVSELRAIKKEMKERIESEGYIESVSPRYFYIETTSIDITSDTTSDTFGGLKRKKRIKK